MSHSRGRWGPLALVVAVLAAVLMVCVPVNADVMLPPQSCDVTIMVAVEPTSVLDPNALVFVGRAYPDQLLDRPRSRGRPESYDIGDRTASAVDKGGPATGGLSTSPALTAG